MDMRTLIKAMLQPQPASRPDTNELLNMTIVQKRMKKYFCEKDGSLMELMKEADMPLDDLMATITMKRPFFK